MIFRPELAEKIREGQKTVMRRPLSENPRSPWWRERCALEGGRAYAVCPGRGKLFKAGGGRTPKASGRELDGRTWDEIPEGISA